MRGELTLGSADGSARRKITAATCDEAVDALTLIAALLTHPNGNRAGAVETPTPQSAALSTSPAKPRDPTRDAPTGARAATELRAPEVTLPARGGEPQSAPGPPKKKVASDPPKKKIAPAPPKKKVSPNPPATAQEMKVDDEPPFSPSERVQRHYVRRGELVLSSLLASGLTPAVRVGAAIEGALGWAAGSLDLMILLGMRIALPHTVHSDEGSARFGWASGVLGGCVGARARISLTGAGCITSELGMITAQGQNTDAPARARPLWAAVGPALRLSYAPLRMLIVAGTLTTLFSTARDRFLVADRELHRVPLLTFRCELGVGVRFE